MRRSEETIQIAWTVGGDIVVAGRRLTMAEADSLSRFYATALSDERRPSDPGAAAYLASQITQLASARAAATRWRRAAGGPAFRTW